MNCVGVLRESCIKLISEVVRMSTCDPSLLVNYALGTTITDVSNQMDNNSAPGSGQGSKQRTSTGGIEDAENSSIGSPQRVENFEGFDS